MKKAIWHILPILLATSGCAVNPPGRIPLGHWEGSGRFVQRSYVRSADDPDRVDASSPTLTKTKDYPTTLTIREIELDNRPLIEVDILSRSGLGDKRDPDIHLRLAIEQVQSLSDAAVLYRLVAAQGNPGPNEALEYDPQADKLRDVYCTTIGGDTYLHIRYDDNYWDVLRFTGNRVEKSGSLFEKHSTTFWTEQLNRR